MKITFVTPYIGRKTADQYIRTWQIESLTIAVLAGCTPSDVELAYFDERMEQIDFDQPTDLVAISTETYTVKRAYEIANEYRRRNVPVVLGGYHPTLVPEEAKRYADSIVLGFAEGTWNQVVSDASHGRLKPVYQCDPSKPITFGMPRREIFGNRRYLKTSCIETGRGCPLSCEFCAITAFANAKYTPRPIEDVLEDIRNLSNRHVLFVDDNVVGNFAYAKELFRRLIPYKIKWFSQGTLSVTRDPELVELMAESGCAGLLIGLESFRPDTLKLMNKKVNLPLVGQYKQSVKMLHHHGIALYGAFVFGYDSEGVEEFIWTAKEAQKLGLFMAAFNPLIPFPGTKLYERLSQEGRLPKKDWWLDPNFRFGDIPFDPKLLTAGELKQACTDTRRYYYSIASILKRAGNVRGNLNSVIKAAYYFYINLKLRQEIDQKCGLPLGDKSEQPVPIYEGGIR